MAIGVQLIGKDQVMQAFSNMKIECWSIYQHKNLLTKGSGDEMLEEFIDLIAKNASAAVYTIKFYEDIDDPKKIKEKTESSGSLNFRLQKSDYEDAGSGEFQDRQHYRKLYEEIAGLKQTIAGIGNDQPQTIEEAVIGLLASPTELVTVISIVRDIFRPSSTPQNQQQQHNQFNSAAVGFIENQNTMKAEKTEQQLQNELKRLQDAVTILDNNDPKLIEHLERLAMMAQSDPSKFKMLLGLLEKF